MFEAYILVCDNCKEILAYNAQQYLPQQLIVHAIEREGWTVAGDVAHCVSCPPLCKCGIADDWCPICLVTSGQG